MSKTPASRSPADGPGGSRRVDRVRRRGAVVVLTLSLVGLTVGAVLHLAGVPAAATDVWRVVAVVGGLVAGMAVVEGLRAGRVGVDVIALLAAAGALVVGEALAAAVIGVMILSGRTLESWAAGRARRDLADLVGRAPRNARRYREGSLEVVGVDELEVGDRLLVGAGELVAVDGTVVSELAVLDESTLSGESLPVEHLPGDTVRSGTVNAGPPFDLRATTTAAGGTYAGVVRLVAEAEASQAPFVRLADRYALWFLVGSLAAAGTSWAVAGPARAVAVLVVATPCPLILGAPVALVSGIARAARRGVIVKGGGVLERLGRCRTLLIDKTGTLTEGRPTLAEILPAGPMAADGILALAASLDQVSPHVLAVAVVRAAADRHIPLVLPEEVEEVAGRGIRGVVGGVPVAVGNADWVGLAGAPTWARAALRKARLDGALTVFVAAAGEPVGVLVLDDPIRPDAGRTVRALRRGGIDRIVMVTGDRSEVAETIGAVIGVDEVLADRSPAEKLEVVRRESGRAPTIMVGDGVNDAPALALADVGVALGARGASAPSEAADAVLTVDRIDRLGEVVALARRTRRIALQSVSVGMALSVLAMAVAAAGFLPAVWGALLQEGIDVAVILNALRALLPARGGLRLDDRDVAVTRRFQDEHLAIRGHIAEVRAAADALGHRPLDPSLSRVRGVHRLLVEEVGPHEEAEQSLLYPALDRLLGGEDPTGTMSRAHVEIAHQIRRLGQLLEEIDPGGPDENDVIELQRLLYGLHAILRLHTAQEDESYLSLDDAPALETVRP